MGVGGRERPVTHFAPENEAAASLQPSGGIGARMDKTILHFTWSSVRVVTKQRNRRVYTEETNDADATGRLEVPSCVEGGEPQCGIARRAWKQASPSCRAPPSPLADDRTTVQSTTPRAGSKGGDGGCRWKPGKARVKGGGATKVRQPILTSINQRVTTRPLRVGF